MMNVVAKGAFSVINIVTPGTHADRVTIKITVDGVMCVEKAFNDDYLWRSAGKDYAGATEKGVQLDFGLVHFATSLKVELKMSFADIIHTSVMYQLYP